MTVSTNAALIGLGMVADMHAAAIAATDGRVRLAGVHARDPGRTAAFAARAAPGARAYQSVAEIAADPAIDFAIVLTPPDARDEIVGALAAAGKPILLEKPVERNFAAAARIVEACERAGAPLGVVLQHRMRPAARHLAGLIAGGDLGPLAAVEVSVPWWRDQAYYDQPGRGDYARDGGGVLITQAIHTLDLALSLTGPATRVQALARTTALHLMEAEDFVSAGIEFANGAVGAVTASTASFPGGGERIVMQFANAAATLDAATLTVHHRSGEVERVGAAGGSGGGADPMAFTHEWHQAVIEDFADSLAAGAPPAITGRDALPVHALIDAMQLSSREGRIVDIEREIGHA